MKSTCMLLVHTYISALICGLSGLASATVLVKCKLFQHSVNQSYNYRTLGQTLGTRLDHYFLKININIPIKLCVHVVK